MNISDTRPVSEQSTARRRFIYALFVLSGSAALIYEVLWTRELSLLFGSTVYAVSTMLAAFMTGLTLGAWIIGRWADKTHDPARMFAMLEAGVAVFGLLSVPLIKLLPALYFGFAAAVKPPLWIFLFAQFILSLLIMIVPTTLMGGTFPVVTRMVSRSTDSIGEDVGSLYSVNTFGSLVGSIAAGFVLIPSVGIQGTVLIAAAVNMTTSLLAVALFGVKPKWRLFTLYAVIALLAVWVSLQWVPASLALSFDRLGSYRTYSDYLADARSSKLVFSRDGLYGGVAVFRDRSGGLVLQNGGDIEGSTHQIDLWTESMLALLPMGSVRRPHSVMVIGLGTGYTAEAALESGGKVTTVEINPDVVSASRYFVGDRLERNADWRLVINDGRNQLLRESRTYDVITSEPSWPTSDHVAHLFTKEFFELGRSRLKDDGVFCQWLPRYMLEKDDLFMMMKTFRSVFPNVYVWGVDVQGVQGHDVLMIGVNGDRSLDESAVAEWARARDKTGAQFKLYETPESVARRTSSPAIPINSDDHPRLPYRVVANRLQWALQNINSGPGSQ